MTAAVLLIYLVIAFVSDIRTRRIPNKLNAAACVTGLLYHTVDSGLQGLQISILGIGIGFGIMTPLFLMKGIGAGDVKLFMGIGAVAGPITTVYCVMYSILLGGFIGGLYVLGCKCLGSSSQAKRQMPFMLAVLPSAILIL